ncbi:DUF2637 domain-containing protein [Microtetraspora sp. AC03309]|uniref:DUF2637 domain-containing protein n=1 Tax=Microtetraspora sp. AC03309 TaxID=2779376 RepID=UPI001E31941A|nr:DUF2637 domain-containing protein [Microtetraspora sp. AC03309]MCC5582099.1 DUF2637 domain-containing protein [Microtetraspora sp. AC03309]
MSMTASRLALRLADSGPVLILAAIAGAGSFTHIRDTATESGQEGWMAWAVAVCVDLTCVMAARERQRDKKTGRIRRGWVSWPTLVLVAGIVLSLAANLHQADPSVWGWLTAATPAGAFLVAVSMLERRASGPHLEPSPVPSSAIVPASSPLIASPYASPALVPSGVPAPSSTVTGSSSASASPSSTDGGPSSSGDGSSSVPALVPTDEDEQDDGPGPSSALVDYARRVADEHHSKHGRPITRDLLRARLGVSNQLASDLLRTLRPAPDAF